MCGYMVHCQPDWELVNASTDDLTQDVVDGSAGDEVDTATVNAG